MQLAAAEAQAVGAAPLSLAQLLCDRGSLTFCRVEGFRPIIVVGFKVHGDPVQVAEASFALVGTEETKVLLALSLRKRVEDVVDLWGQMTGSEDAAAD